MTRLPVFERPFQCHNRWNTGEQKRRIQSREQTNSQCNADGTEKQTRIVIKSTPRLRPINSLNEERLTTICTITIATTSDIKERKTDSPRNENINVALPDPRVFFIAISVARFADFAVDRFM